MTPSGHAEAGAAAPFWQSVREALAGSHQDYTAAPLTRAILMLAIPMVLEMCMESLLGLVDMFFVSKLGSDAMATVGLTESMLTLVFAAALALSMAATATIARRIGEKDPEGAANAAVQVIAIGVLVSSCVGLLGVAFAPQMLRLMGATPRMVASGIGYTRTILGGSITIFLLFLINAVFRGAGDAAVAMRSLWLANIVNIFLNPILIFGLAGLPGLGVKGSAVAATISRGIGVLYQLYVLGTGQKRVRITRAQIHLDWKVMFQMLRLSLGALFQFVVQMASWIGLIRIVSTFGPQAIAGYTLAIRIIVFAILPSWGLSNAAATLVGQNLGAGKPDRAERAVWLTGFYNMIFLGTIGLLFIVFAPVLVSWFTTDPAVVPTAIHCLRYISCGYVFYGYGMVVVSSFNGAGDTTTPTLINLFCYWMFQIPLAWVLSYRTSLGVSGAFLAIAIGESTLAVVGILAFRRGTWKLKRV